LRNAYRRENVGKICRGNEIHVMCIMFSASWIKDAASQLVKSNQMQLYILYILFMCSYYNLKFYCINTVTV
jgi:hypothetical protein